MVDNMVTDSNEVPFSFNELFFSRTDTRGIILSGNNVFQRISLYEWKELLKKPHNLIRHADMPKGVFYLFWDTLKRGEPIGAYVKNRAKDGRHYWVFAIATPVKGGFLSVRIKPGSELLKIVEEEYRALVALEYGGKLTPKESAEKLLGRLKELGFNNYQEFMSAAISKEMACRDQHLGLGEDSARQCFDDIMLEAQPLLKQAENIHAAYSRNEYVPLNLQIQSAQLGDQGATIDVISRNYHVISTEIKDKIGEFMQSAKQVFSTINDARFLFSVAVIQNDVVGFFEKEDAVEGFSKAEEMQYLQNQQEEYRQKALDGMKSIIRQTKQFEEDCYQMKRLALALEVTRVMGKVESARLNETKDGLNELIEDLASFQRSIADSLKQIEQLNRRIKYGVGSLTHSAKVA